MPCPARDRRPDAALRERQQRPKVIGQAALEYDGQDRRPRHGPDDHEDGNQVRVHLAQHGLGEQQRTDEHEDRRHHRHEQADEDTQPEPAASTP